MKVQAMYQDKQILTEVQEFFEEHGFIQLVNFLDSNMEDLKKNLQKQNFEKKYIPDEKSLSILDTTQLYDLEVIQLLEYFKSKQFLEYIEQITQLELQFKQVKIKKYSHKDFTILHDNMKREDVMEVYFDLTSNWKEEMGGVLTFTTREEEVFYLEPLCNALTILFKPSEVMKYLKYINNKSEGNSILRVEIQFDLSED